MLSITFLRSQALGKLEVEVESFWVINQVPRYNSDIFKAQGQRLPQGKNWDTNATPWIHESQLHKPAINTVSSPY